MMFIWFIILGGLVYYLVYGDLEFWSLKRKNSDSIIDERLAKGEISIEEYRKIKSALKEKLE